MLESQIAPSLSDDRGLPADVWPSLTTALLARIPVGCIGLLIVLEVVGSGLSYATAGVAVAICGVGAAAGAPLLGRLADRLGQTRALLLSGVGSLLGLTSFALVSAGTPSWVLMLLAAICGVAQPPVAAAARALWRAQYRPSAFARVVMIDTALQEVAFTIGPVAFVPLATYTRPWIALAALGAVSGASSVAFALLPPTRRLARNRRRFGGSWLGPLVHPGVCTLVMVSTSVGTGFGATELGLIRMAAAFGARGATGLLFAAISTGSLTGGLVASRVPIRRPVRRALSLISVYAVANCLLAAAPNVLVLGALLLCGGFVIAPSFGVIYLLMGEVAPPAMATEAFALTTAGLTAGFAVGAAIAGAASEVFRGAPFFAAGAAIAVGAIVVWWRAGTLASATEQLSSASAPPSS